MLCKRLIKLIKIKQNYLLQYQKILGDGRKEVRDAWIEAIDRLVLPWADHVMFTWQGIPLKKAKNKATSPQWQIKIFWKETKVDLKKYFLTCQYENIRKCQHEISATELIFSIVAAYRMASDLEILDKLDKSGWKYGSEKFHHFFQKSRKITFFSDLTRNWLIIVIKSF